jgi:tetratricopeptide (TPR) repeat protein
MAEVEDVMKLLREAKVDAALKLAEEVGDRKEMVIRLTEFAGSLDWLKEKSYTAGIILLKAIELYPEYAVSHYNLAVVLTDLDVIADHHEYAGLAEREYRIAVRLDPSFAAARYNLALLYYFTGRLDESRREYEKAVELEPSEPKFKELGILLEASKSASHHS